MFESKIQQKSGTTLLFILLVSLVTFPLIFYFLFSKSQNLRNQPSKINQQLETSTEITKESNYPPPAPVVPEPPYKADEKGTITLKLSPFRYEPNPSEIGDFYFLKTEELEFKDYGIESIGSSLTSFRSNIRIKNLANPDPVNSSEEIFNEVLTFPKEFLITSLKESFQKLEEAKSTGRYKGSTESNNQVNYENLIKKLEKMKDVEYRRWLLKTIKNRSEPSLIMIDYIQGKDLINKDIIILRLLQSLTDNLFFSRDLPPSYYKAEIFLYSYNLQKWIKIWPSKVYYYSACGPEGPTPTYFNFYNRLTIFSFEEIGCGIKGILEIPSLSNINIGYVFYDNKLVPVFFNLKDKYVLLLSQLLPSYAFPDFKNLVEHGSPIYEEKRLTYKNLIIEFPNIARIYKDNTYDYLLISHNYELWLAIYDRKDKIIKERKFIKKLNKSLFTYLYSWGSYGDYRLPTKIPIIVDMDEDGLNEILIPDDNPFIKFKEKYSLYNIIKPVKIEFYKFIPNEQRFILIDKKDICKISNSYFEKVQLKIPDKLLSLYRAKLKPMKVSYIEPNDVIERDFFALMYNICLNDEYKFSYMLPYFEEKEWEGGSIGYSTKYAIPGLLKISKINNYYILLYYTISGGYGGVGSRSEWLAIFVTIYDIDNEEVYTYLLDTTEELRGYSNTILSLDLSNIVVDKNKIKLDLRFSIIDEIGGVEENIKREYLIKVKEDSERVPLIFQFSTE
jgi:hypothetical protein